MTDKEKLDKLVAEIKRLHHQSLVDENRQAEWGLSSAACTSYGKSKVCKELLSFYNSMQEEPKECMYSKDNYTDEDRKVLCDGCEEECKFNKEEESVSEDLEEAARKYFKSLKDDCFIDSDIMLAFKAGANWQKKQFEKNRLKHCNSITNEQAELEQGFIDQHLDKYNRMPTFLDAIEYGMRLQKEQMMEKAVDGMLYSTICGSEQNVVAYVGYGEYGKDGDRVKLIIIKEE